METFIRGSLIPRMPVVKTLASLSSPSYATDVLDSKTLRLELTLKAMQSCEQVVNLCTGGPKP